MNIFLIILTIISLFIYNLISSVVLFLTPRWLRKKKDITGQKILITGAGSGLGRQLAIQFSKHSTCLILLDINKQSLQETSKMLDTSSNVFIYECDVTDRKIVYEVANNIKSDIGDVDILVNNAGIVSGKSFLDLADEGIMKTMEVNTISHFWICKSFLPAMMARNSGHIVTIASVVGLTPVPRLTDYCASKYAAIGFSECLELEMREKKLDGIKVTIVFPAHINTGLFDGAKLSFGSILSPEYVAEEIVAGVLEEKESIFLPSYFSFLLTLKSIIPRWLLLVFYEKTGNIKIMENFKGKAANNSVERLEKLKDT